MNINDALYIHVLRIILLMTIDIRSIVTARKSLSLVRSVCVYWSQAVMAADVLLHCGINLMTPIVYRSIKLRLGERQWRGNIIDKRYSNQKLMILKADRRILMKYDQSIRYHQRHIVLMDDDKVTVIDANLDSQVYVIKREKDRVYRDAETNIGIIYIPQSLDRLMKLDSNGAIKELLFVPFSTYFYSFFHTGMLLSESLDDTMIFLEYRTLSLRPTPLVYTKVLCTGYSTNIPFIGDKNTLSIYDPMNGRIVKEISFIPAIKVDISECILIESRLYDLFTGEVIDVIESSSYVSDELEGYYDGGQIYIVDSTNEWL